MKDRRTCHKWRASHPPLTFTQLRSNLQFSFCPFLLLQDETSPLLSPASSLLFLPRPPKSSSSSCPRSSLPGRHRGQCLVHTQIALIRCKCLGTTDFHSPASAPSRLCARSLIDESLEFAPSPLRTHGCNLRISSVPHSGQPRSEDHLEERSQHCCNTLEPRII